MLPQFKTRGFKHQSRHCVPHALKDLQQHRFETTSVIQCLVKNECFNMLGPGPQNVETFVFPHTADDRGCFKQVSQCRPQTKRNATCLCEGTAPVCSICHAPLVGRTGVPRAWHPKWLVPAK
jgi:hypothetical protein